MSLWLLVDTDHKQSLTSLSIIIYISLRGRREKAKQWLSFVYASEAARSGPHACSDTPGSGNAKKRLQGQDVIQDADIFANSA